MNSNRTSPSSPSRTVSPLKKTARPAVATVIRTASPTRSGPSGPERQLLAEPARHQQRVVDAEPEPEQRREVEHEDAHRHQRGDDEDRRQRDDDRRAADDQRDARRDQRAEDEDQRERRQRQRDDLAPPQVGLRDGLDVAVEGWSAGQLDVEPGRRSQSRSRRIGSASGESSGGRSRKTMSYAVWPSAETWRRREEVRHDAGDVRRGRDVADRVGRGDLERRRPGLERRAREDDDERRRRRAELGLEERLGPCRFEVVEDEPAGAQLARDLRRERDARPAAGRPTRRRPTRRGARRSGRVDRMGSRQGFASDSTTDERTAPIVPAKPGPFRAVGRLLASARAALPRRLPAADPVRDLRRSSSSR